MLKFLASACVFALLAFASTATYAQTTDYRTYFTFSGPVTLPGVTLPAGKYLMRNLDTPGGNRVVQVLSGDGRTAYAQLLTIPVERLDPPTEPEVRFMETPEGMAPAVKAWWYPGKTIGWEFIYPREQAMRLARGVSEPTMTAASVQGEVAEAEKTANVAQGSASSGETAVTVEETPVAPVAETSQQGEPAPTT